MLNNLKLYNDEKDSKQIIKQFYNGLNQENFHEAVTSLEERKHKAFPHGAVYFQNDLPTEKQNDLNLSKSDGLFIIDNDGTQEAAIIPLQVIVQFLASNREQIAEDKALSLIQLENIIDRLELTLKSEEL